MATSSMTRPSAQTDRDNLVVHAGLWVRRQEFPSMFGQPVIRQDTHRSHDAPFSDLRRHRRFHDRPGMTTHLLVDNKPPPTLEADQASCLTVECSVLFR